MRTAPNPLTTFALGAVQRGTPATAYPLRRGRHLFDSQSLTPSAISIAPAYVTASRWALSKAPRA